MPPKISLFCLHAFHLAKGSRGDSRVIEANMLPMGDMDGLNSATGHSVANGRQEWPIMSPQPIPRGCRYANFPAPKTVRAW
jgi:hypothetical protein